MKHEIRHRLYRLQRRGGALTPAQLRRLKHKDHREEMVRREDERKGKRG